MDDPEIRFSFFPLRDRSTIDLLAHLEEARVGRGGPDPFASRAWALRVAEIQRELAIRNRRETERQDALPPIAAEVALPQAQREADLREAERWRLVADRLADALTGAAEAPDLVLSEYQQAAAEYARSKVGDPCV